MQGLRKREKDSGRLRQLNIGASIITYAILGGVLITVIVYNIPQNPIPISKAPI